MAIPSCTKRASSMNSSGCGRSVLSPPTRVLSQDGTGNDTVNGGTESCMCQRDTGDQVSNCPLERRGSRCQKTIHLRDALVYTGTHLFRARERKDEIVG